MRSRGEREQRRCDEPGDEVRGPKVRGGEISGGEMKGGNLMLK